MNRFTRRAPALAAALILAGLASSNTVFAQGATVGPAGGVPSNSAPSNNEGSPAGGTGTLGSTRVGPSGIAPVANPGTAPDTMSAAPRHRRHRRHHARHHASSQVGTQSQDGTNQ